MLSSRKPDFWIIIVDLHKVKKSYKVVSQNLDFDPSTAGYMFRSRYLYSLVTLLRLRHPASVI